MASQIAHIIYAQKYFEKYPSTIDKDEFLLGCAFPDIRRIAENISRKDTHMRFSPLDLNFEGLTSFQAGWKFHTYCDMRREEILNKYKFYTIKDTDKFWNNPTKQLEDSLVYKDYNNWEKVISYFNNVPKIETGLNISQETLSLWYAVIAKYLEKKPDDKSMHIYLSKIGFESEADEMILVIDKLRKNEKVIEVLKKIKGEIV